jgi:esterase/lipase
MKNVVLLHGALGAASDLTALAESLKSLGIIAHSLSFSGHGTTPFSAGFGIDQFAKELEDFILKNSLKDVSVFGYSMGGFVALHLATQKPELIDKIVTLGTKFNWSKETVDKETKLLDPEIMIQKIPAYTKLLEAKHGQQWKELVVKTADMMKQMGERNFLDAESLRKINSQTLIGIADKDQMVGLDETVSVYKALPAGCMYMLPNTKHQMESVNIGILSRIILDFIV